MAGPADDAGALIARLRAARERWVQLTPGKRVKMRRPAEAEFPQFMRGDVGGGRTLVVELDHVQRYAVDWDGITEADLLGAAVGVSDPVPFDAAVWAEVVADHGEWLDPAARGLLQAIVEHHQAREAQAGNSAATSTPGPAA